MYKNVYLRIYFFPACNCDEKYSAGAVCNPVSGICQCLPGVLGDKCDKCPYRWVFLKNQGCLG